MKGAARFVGASLEEEDKPIEMKSYIKEEVDEETFELFSIQVLGLGPDPIGIKFKAVCKLYYLSKE